MQISVCFPTLKRYDLLEESIKSLQHGILKPTDIWVIDNGVGYVPKHEPGLDEFGINHHYVTFGHNLGCAASWNWFARNVPDVRIISNDDISFHPDTVRKMVHAYDPTAIHSPDSIIGSNSFSCFVLPDHLYNCVGEFDETLSPNYAYFEDVDYSLRLRRMGFKLLGVPNCSVDHLGSSTLKSYDDAEMEDHNFRFIQAQMNYMVKWGGVPNHETYQTPYNL